MAISEWLENCGPDAPAADARSQWTCLAGEVGSSIALSRTKRRSGATVSVVRLWSKRARFEIDMAIRFDHVSKKWSVEGEFLIGCVYTGYVFKTEADAIACEEFLADFELDLDDFERSCIANGRAAYREELHHRGADNHYQTIQALLTRCGALPKELVKPTRELCAELGLDLDNFDRRAGK